MMRSIIAGCFLGSILLASASVVHYKDDTSYMAVLLSKATDPNQWLYSSYVAVLPPTDVKAVLDEDRIIVAWKPGVNATFTIFSNGTSSFALSSDLTMFQQHIDVKPWKLFTFTLKSCTADNQCSETVTVSVRTPAQAPSAPYNLTVESVVGEAILVWQPPVEPNGPIDGYVITYRELGLGRDYKNVIEVEGALTNYTLSNLNSLKDFEVELRAFNLYDNHTKLVSPGMSLNFTTPPGKPERPINLVLFSVSNSTADLRWEKPIEVNGDLDGYYVEWCFRNTASCDSEEIRYNVTDDTRYYETIILENLKPGAIYNVSVFAFNLDGDDVILGHASFLLFQTIPDVPSCLTPNVLAPTAVAISCSKDRSLSDVLFKIEYERQSAPKATFIQTLEASRVISNLEPWSSQVINVSACPVMEGAITCSKKIFLQVETPPADFPSPVLDRILSSGPTSFSVSWGLPTEYEGRRFDGFSVEVCTTQTSCDYVYVQSNTLRLTMDDRKPNTTYQVAIRAYIVMDKTRLFSRPLLASIKTWNTVPEQPINVVAEPLSGQAVLLRWDIVNSTVDEGYIITGLANNTNATADGELTETILYSLLPYSNYTFGITGCSRNGCGQPATVNVMTKSGAPSPPVDVAPALDTAKSTLTITWKEPQIRGGQRVTYDLSYQCSNNITKEIKLADFSNTYTVTNAHAPCTISLSASTEENGIVFTGESVTMKV